MSCYTIFFFLKTQTNKHYILGNICRCFLVCLCHGDCDRLDPEQIQHRSEMYVAITYYKGWNRENTSAKTEKTGLVQVFSESNPPKQNKTRAITFCTTWALKWPPNEMKVPAVPHSSLKFETSHLKGSVQMDFFLEIRVSPLVDNI